MRKGVMLCLLAGAAMGMRGRRGADDSASGAAVLIGLARYFAKQPKPNHTLMFVASGGHHALAGAPLRSWPRILS